MEPASSTRRVGADVLAAQVLAWAGIAAITLVATAADSVLAGKGAWFRIAHAAYLVGYCAALGVLSSALAVAWSRARGALAPRLGARAALFVDLAALAAAAYAPAFAVLAPELINFAGDLAWRLAVSAELVRAVVVLVIATGIPLAALAGRALARPRLRWIGVALALALAAANQLVLTSDYPGGHLYLAWAAAVLGGSAIATLPLPPRSPRLRALALSFAVLLGAWSVIVRPGDVLLLALLSERGSTLAPFLARARITRAPAGKPDLPSAWLPWFADRAAVPPIPPTSPPSAPDPIVILFTIDAVRAEVIESGRHDALLPELTRLKRESAHFTEARSPGAGTVFTFSALFSGKYYSEQYWTPMPGQRQPYPWRDDTVQFPELLTRAGVPTVSVVTVPFLLGKFGVARGFAENAYHEPRKGKHRAATGRDLGQLLLEQLDQHDVGPLFVWIHDMDPHEPYNLGGTDGSLYERYLREVALADAEIGKLRAFLAARGWEDRTTLIVAADHGEGFDEHGTTSHSNSVYEELLRVPLLIVGPGVRPRAEPTPVSLMDLGPTILDLLGVPTPGTWMGESLVPLLRGAAPALTRPIGAETRLKQAIVLPGGIKVIRDLHLGTREIYDLVRDPGEQHNLIDEPGAQARLDLLAAFFDAHTLKRPGYEPPYRAW